MGAVGWVGKGTPARWTCGRSSPLGRMMETEPSAAVLSLLRRHGLHAHEPQLRALGATTPLHLFQLVLEDLDELDPPLAEGERRAFAALLAAGDGAGAAGEGATPPPTEEQLREALRLEDALRTSHDGQRRFSDAETRDDADWLFVAAEMQHAIELPILIDSPQPGTDGAFEAAYAPWPLRFYGCERGTAEEEQWRLGYIATPEQCEYSLANLRAWLICTLAAK